MNHITFIVCRARALRHENLARKSDELDAWVMQALQMDGQDPRNSTVWRNDRAFLGMSQSEVHIASCPRGWAYVETSVEQPEAEFLGFDAEGLARYGNVDLG